MNSTCAVLIGPNREGMLCLTEKKGRKFYSNLVVLSCYAFMS